LLAARSSYNLNLTKTTSKMLLTKMLTEQALKALLMRVMRV
jgi:hypothetical protein